MLTYRMLERLAYIDARIRKGAYPNSTDFAKELECGIATVKRDIDFLRDRYAAPIAYDASQRGYYYTEPYTLFQNMISVQDAAALAVAKRLLIQYEGTPVYDDLCRAVDGIMALHNGLCFLSIDRIAAPPAPKIIFNENDWRLICRSLTENRIIEFDYNGRWHTETSHRRVHPYQILLHEGVFHLFGYAEERKAERLFCLPRMKNIIVTEDVFSIVDTYFMPYGIECDLYSIMGEILAVRRRKNSLTGVEVYQMKLNVNELQFDICVPADSVMGEPEIGRRYKGTVWLQGYINF